MKYKATYMANNGTCMPKPIESNNLAQIIKDIREIAEGERFSNNKCKWEVYSTESNNMVASGYTDQNGKRYRTL